MRKILVLAALLVFIVLTTTQLFAAEAGEPYYRSGNFTVAGDSYNYIDLGLGAYAFHNTDDGDGSFGGNLELRFGKKYFFVGPLVGVLANSDEAFYAYGGFYSDLAFGKFVITPMAGIGGYHKGKSRDLGGVLTFRLGLTFAYEVSERIRAGFRLGHLSNANSQDKNPGEDEALLSLSVGF